MASGLSAGVDTEAESASREGEQLRGQNSRQVKRRRAPKRSSSEAVDNDGNEEAQDKDKEAWSDVIRVPGIGETALDGKARAERSTGARHSAEVHDEQSDAKRLKVEADLQRAKRASTEASVASCKMIRNQLCARVLLSGRSCGLWFAVGIAIGLGKHIDPEIFGNIGSGDFLISCDFGQLWLIGANFGKCRRCGLHV